MHRLLQRQIKRHLGEDAELSPSLEALLEAVNEVYEQTDRDRTLLERSMELASQELFVANQHLQKERERLQLAFSLAPAAIAIYHGPEQRIVLANETFHVWTGRDQVIGQTFAEAFPELVGSPAHDALLHVFSTGSPFNAREMEVMLMRGGVTEQTFWNFVIQPLAAGEDSVSDMLVHAVEITDQVLARRAIEENAAELRRIASALEESNSDLDQFAYVASHDLRTPLRGIGALSEWIEADLGPNASEEVRNHLLLLRTRVHRLDALIDGILQYSRAGRHPGSVGMVDLNELVAEIRDLCCGVTPGRVITRGRLPVIRAERLPLQQVLQNLISNGLKYGGADGAEPVVEVSVTDDGAFWNFVVSDNGPGVGPEYQERIFGLFQRLQSQDEVEGSGIGLALVRKIVQRRGGSVHLESEPGQGARFIVRLPKLAHDPASDGAEMATYPPASETGITA
jgi:signal transduction histidine kinase